MSQASTHICRSKHTNLANLKDEHGHPDGTVKDHSPTAALALDLCLLHVPEALLVVTSEVPQCFHGHWPFAYCTLTCQGPKYSDLRAPESSTVGPWGGLQ